MNALAASIVICSYIALCKHNCRKLDASTAVRQNPSHRCISRCGFRSIVSNVSLVRANQPKNDIDEEKKSRRERERKGERYTDRKRRNDIEKKREPDPIYWNIWNITESRSQRRSVAIAKVDVKEKWSAIDCRVCVYSFWVLSMFSGKKNWIIIDIVNFRKKIVQRRRIDLMQLFNCVTPFIIQVLILWCICAKCKSD